MQARLIYLIPISRSEDIEFIVSRYLHYEHVQYINVDNWKVDIEVIGNSYFLKALLALSVLSMIVKVDRI